MGIETALYVLLGFVILSSVIAIEIRDLLSSVIAVGAGGAAVALIFLMLGAPDLAIVQLVVEVICLILLIRVITTRDDTTYDSYRDRFTVATGLGFVGFFILLCYKMVQGMASFGSPKLTVGGEYLDRSLEATGSANVMMAVLLDFRAYDTLGEATVIFTAVIGVYAVLRKVGRKPLEGHDVNR